MQFSLNSRVIVWQKFFANRATSINFIDITYLVQIFLTFILELATICVIHVFVRNKLVEVSQFLFLKSWSPIILPDSRIKKFRKSVDET